MLAVRWEIITLGGRAADLDQFLSGWRQVRPADHFDLRFLAARCEDLEHLVPGRSAAAKRVINGEKLLPGLSSYELGRHIRRLLSEADTPLALGLGESLCHDGGLGFLQALAQAPASDSGSGQALPLEAWDGEHLRQALQAARAFLQARAQAGASLSLWTESALALTGPGGAGATWAQRFLAAQNPLATQAENPSVENPAAPQLSAPHSSAGASSGEGPDQPVNAVEQAAAAREEILQRLAGGMGEWSLPVTGSPQTSKRAPSWPSSGCGGGVAWIGALLSQPLQPLLDATWSAALVPPNFALGPGMEIAGQTGEREVAGVIVLEDWIDGSPAPWGGIEFALQQWQSQPLVPVIVLAKDSYLSRRQVQELGVAGCYVQAENPRRDLTEWGRRLAGTWSVL